MRIAELPLAALKLADVLWKLGFRESLVEVALPKIGERSRGDHAAFDFFLIHLKRGIAGRDPTLVSGF